MSTINPGVKGLFVLLAIALLTQCKEEEPSTEASIDTRMELVSNSAIQGKLTIENVSLELFQIDMDAKKDDGNQHVFSAVNAAEDKRVEVVNSDIDLVLPGQQGSYEPVQVILTLEPDPYELIVTPGTEGNPPSADYQDFLQNAKPSILITGTYNNRGSRVRVVIALDVANPIKAQATQLGESLIKIGAKNMARIRVDPSYLLSDITNQELENAVTIDHNGTPLIFIHESFNDHLYEDILDRLSDSSAMQVEIIKMNANG